MNREEQIESGVYYHVYNRGNNREQIFGDKSDYVAFIEKMKSLTVKYAIEIPVYTLMPNHYHLIARQVALEEGLQGDLQISKPRLSQMMGALATSAAKRYNLKYGHIGHLFQGQYRYKPISDDAFWDVARYIHLNPVRAGLAKKPEDWEFSNYIELAETKVTFNIASPEMKVTFYRELVEKILKDEQEEKEYWKKIQQYLM